MIIKAKDISKAYIDGSEKLDVLKNLNLEVHEPGIIIISGPSGSGKTTLLNILSTLDIPNSGEVKINGKKINWIFKNTIYYKYTYRAAGAFRRWAVSVPTCR